MDFSRIIKRLEEISVEGLEVVQYRFNVEALEFQSIATIETVNRLLRRFNVSIEYHIYTHTYTVYNADDKKHLDTCCKNINVLSDVFFHAMRAGATQDEAKAIQHEYATKYNMIESFNAIYA